MCKNLVLRSDFIHLSSHLQCSFKNVVFFIGNRKGNYIINEIMDYRFKNIRKKFWILNSCEYCHHQIPPNLNQMITLNPLDFYLLYVNPQKFVFLFFLIFISSVYFLCCFYLLSFLSLAGVMVSDNRYIVGDQYLMAPTTTTTTSWK